MIAMIATERLLNPKSRVLDAAVEKTLYEMPPLMVDCCLGTVEESVVFESFSYYQILFRYQ